MADARDIRLIVEIKNKEPLELLELTKSLVALAHQFNGYAAENGTAKEEREAKLYVKEIRSGSVILELIEIATVGVIPFIENVNTIVGFAEYISTAYNFFLGKKKDKQKDFDISDCKELSQIVNPVASDNGSQLNISTTINGDVNLYLSLSSLEANAVQNVLEKEARQMKVPEASDSLHTKVVLSWYQARSDVKSETGNKGVIEEISTKPVNIIFENEDIKSKILLGDANPLHTAYVVDVKPQTVSGKVVAYKVTAFHESISID